MTVDMTAKTRETVAFLNRYSELKSEISEKEAAHSKAMDELIGAETLAKIKAMSKVLSAEISVLKEKIGDIDEPIREGVFDAGHSIAATIHNTKENVSPYECVYHQPGSDWNTTMVEGFALAYPELNGAKIALPPKAVIRKRTMTKKKASK